MIVNTGVILLHCKKVESSTKVSADDTMLVGVGHEHIYLSCPPLPLILCLVRPIFVAEMLPDFMEHFTNLVPIQTQLKLSILLSVFCALTICMNPLKHIYFCCARPPNGTLTHF